MNENTRVYTGNNQRGGLLCEVNNTSDSAAVSYRNPVIVVLRTLKKIYSSSSKILYFRHCNWRLYNHKRPAMSRESVRISEEGMRFLNDKKLTNAVSMAIGNGKEILEKTGSLEVEGTDVTVELVKSLSNEQLTKHK